MAETTSLERTHTPTHPLSAVSLLPRRRRRPLRSTMPDVQRGREAAPREGAFSYDKVIAAHGSRFPSCAKRSIADCSCAPRPGR